MNLDHGIHVDWLNEPQCIRMVWGRSVTDRDVRIAFSRIQTLLDEVGEPRCVLVDISNTPNMPLAPTLQSALAGPYRHPMLRNWLIIESEHNRVAHLLERLLSGATRRRNVYWFASEQEALAFIDSEQMV